MSSINKILCPIDFSEFSRHALDHAVGIAKHYGASITALYVIPPITAWYPPLDIAAYIPYVYTPEELAEMQRSLEQFVQESDSTYPVTAVSVEAPVVTEILDRAATLPADLVVLGTHGRSGFERVVLGSVTERILAKAHCPVLTVPRRSPDAVPFGKVLYPHILCPVDFSPASLRALSYAGDLARETGARVTAMHVLEPVSRFQPVVMGAQATPEFHQFERNEARERLRGALPASVRDATGFVELVIDGKPWEEVVRIAGEREVSLIAVGAHAGTAGAFGFGSTTNRIVREAGCPVLTVRA
jgi:nucleotide-binding universal stress UspA family protein